MTGRSLEPLEDILFAELQPALKMSPRRTIVCAYLIGGGGRIAEARRPDQAPPGRFCPLGRSPGRAHPHRRAEKGLLALIPMGNRIEIARPDGQTCPAYHAPADGPGVVIVQEWWGLNAQIQATADRLASTGFNVVVPDLYRGKVTTDSDEANHMMNNLDWGGAVVDLKASLQHLKQSGKKAAVMGFCMGGALTIIAAANLPETDAGVCFYGIPPAEAADPRQIRVPFLAHFATNDDWCTPSAVDQLEAQLKEGGVDFVLHRYDGQQHAFMNEARPEVYSAEAAKLAWERSVTFLQARLA